MSSAVSTVLFLVAPQPAWQRVQAMLGWQHIPMLYLNYRVFTRTETGEGLELVKR